MKKIMAALLAMVLCVSLLASCKNTEKETNSDASAKPQKDITLNTVSMFGGTDASADEYAAIVEKFDADNEHVTVNDQSQSSSEEWKASVRSSFETGDEPDVLFFFTTSDADDILESCVTLEEIKKEYPDFCNWINESAIEAVTATDGAQYAIPVKGFWEGMFVNEDVFTSNSIDLPTDWDKFTASFEKLNGAKVTPIALGAASEPHYAIENLILAYGSVADHAVNPGTDASKVPQSWFNGLNAFKTLNDMGAFAKGVESADEGAAKELFFNKGAAMLFEGSWVAGSITAPDTTTVLATPAAPEANKTSKDVIAGFSSGFYITRKAWEDADKRAAAVAFVEAAASKDAIAAYCNEGGAPAADVELPADLARPAKDGAAVVGAADGVDGPLGDRMANGFAVMWPEVGNLLTGKTDAKAVIDKFVEANK